jgi:hypothetical protein
MKGDTSTMTEWTKDELRKIAAADDLHISPLHEDGVTYGTPTWIWSVAVDDAVYVHGYNGQNSRWHQAAVRAEGGTDHRYWHDEGGRLQASQRSDQRPHR